MDTFNAFTAESSRILIPNRTYRGNWEDNALRADFAIVTDDDPMTLGPASFPFSGQGQIIGVDVLLFLADRPVHIAAAFALGGHFTRNVDAASAPIDSYTQHLASRREASGFNADQSSLVTLPAGQTYVPSGSVVAAKTATNAVWCEGQPWRIPLPAVSPYAPLDAVAGQAVTAYAGAEIVVVGEAASVHGRHAFNSSNTEERKHQLPILLRESDYTQAMYDAENRIETDDSTYIILGLWAGIALA